jgi:hypothetical protein
MCDLKVKKNVKKIMKPKYLINSLLNDEIKKENQCNNKT